MGTPLGLPSGEVDAATLLLLLLVVLLLCLFEFNSFFSPFLARKLTHLSMGFCILLLLLPETCSSPQHAKLAVCTVAFAAISLCFLRPFRFGSFGDKGIIIFNLLVLVFVFFELDIGFLAPTFIADPLGAIVGRTLNSPKWIGEKTVAGSLAVFLGSFVGAFRVGAPLARLGVALGCTLLEALGGPLDNFFLSLPLLAYYWAHTQARRHGLPFPS